MDSTFKKEFLADMVLTGFDNWGIWLKTVFFISHSYLLLVFEKLIGK